MSWSFSASGKAEKVRDIAAQSLAQSAANCAHIEAEAKGVQAFSESVEAVCAASEGQYVEVAGSGSAWMVEGKLKSYNFSASIKVVDLG